MLVCLSGTLVARCSTHTYTCTDMYTRTHFSIPSNCSFWWRAAPRRSVPVLSSHSSFFPPRYTLSDRISSSFLFLQRASSSRLFFIEFLPTTAARRDYLWPLETIEERWKHPRIHFRIHPPPPLHEKRLGGRYEGGHHQFIEADRSSRRRWKQDAVYIVLITRSFKF